MSFEIDAADQWFHETFSADAELVAAIPVQRYDQYVAALASVTPGNIPVNTFPRITYGFHTGGDNQGLGTIRLLTRLIYRVLVVQYRWEGATEVAIALNRIDELIGEAVRGSVIDQQGNRFQISARRMNPLRYPEKLGATEDFFMHSGGLYLLEVSADA